MKRIDFWTEVAGEKAKAPDEFVTLSQISDIAYIRRLESAFTMSAYPTYKEVTGVSQKLSTMSARVLFKLILDVSAISPIPFYFYIDEQNSLITNVRLLTNKVAKSSDSYNLGLSHIDRNNLGESNALSLDVIETVYMEMDFYIEGLPGTDIKLMTSSGDITNIVIKQYSYSKIMSEL